ncbi:DDE superfamily endonuclease [Nitzschia inconspicua]|uniref:DDE superfamily endonuclease n=1 Tax=Nitzschia inconspicua TaxID=303405 RepID=A0A9K3KQZ1_9STRA|nr:DDE superfamily endonuclease [Nitzschia inconspicua]
MSTSAPSTAAIEFVGKSTLHKELQRTIAVVCWDEVNTVVKSSGLSKEDQQDMAYKLYHGDVAMSDSMGYSEQLLNALGMWKCLFTKDIPDPKSNYPGLIMKRQYHRQEKEIKVHPDEDEAQINLALLRATFLNKRQMVSGRAIIDGGKMVIANARIMLDILQHSIYQPYLKSGSLPSGLEWDDYLEFLLDSFWKHQHTATATSKKEQAEKDMDSGNKTNAIVAKKKKTPPAQKKEVQPPKKRKKTNTEEEESDEHPDDDDEEEEEEDVFVEEVKKRPKNWLWTGYIAFAIFGPIVPPDQEKKHQLKIFFTSDGRKENQSINGGRSLLRKKKQEEDKRKSSVSPTSQQVQTTVLGTDIICKVMKAGIAIQAATMHYQRIADRARHEMQLAQIMYTNTMEEYLFWGGQLDTDQLKHPELNTEDHAVGMYLKAMGAMNKWQEKLDRLETKVEAGYSVDPMYQAIVDDVFTQSSMHNNNNNNNSLLDTMNELLPVDGTRKRLVAPMSQQVQTTVLGTDIICKVMKAGIAIQAATMHYQRIADRARHEMQLAQIMYKNTMEECRFWRGQLDTDQLKHPELNTEDHAVGMYLEALDEMEERKAELNRLEANQQAMLDGYAVDHYPNYQAIIDDVFTQSSMHNSNNNNSLLGTTNELLLVDGTIKLMQWLMIPLEHTPSAGSPEDIWECYGSDGLLDPVKYNFFLSERAEHEGLEHQMFLDAMMSLLLSQCMAANEDKKEPNNKVPRKRRKKGIVHYIDRDGKRQVLPPTMSMWYNLYCRHDADDETVYLSKFHTKFRRRFRMPFDSYKDLCIMAAGSPLFERWRPGHKDAVGKESAPLNLLILGVLHYLGRGRSFDDLQEVTAISEEVLRVFFHVFIEFGSTVLYDKFVTSHLINRSNQATLHDFAKSMEVEYAQAGFPGCIGSIDASHIACEKVRFCLGQNHLSFKLPYTSRTYNMTCNHRRLAICTTDGHPAGWNDKSIQHFDKLATGLNNGTLLPDLPFELDEYDNEGNVVKKKYRGAWLLVDNGYLASAQIEAMRKDVACAFGILKGRWRVLKAGVRVQGVEKADKIFKTCVALHNWLLEVDGRADEWGEGIPSDWEGELGRQEQDDEERIPVPDPIRRLNTSGAVRNYDTSGMGPGEDATNDREDEEEIIANVQEEEGSEDGEIVVHRLSRAIFRERLIRHFDIAFTKREIKWPN